jgi:purine-nucleoside phosphorylase
MILGTGLGRLADDVDAQTRLAYREIPHFPPATAPTHAGTLVCGTLGGVPIAAMAGRLHAYEGYSPAQVTFGVRVMAALGVQMLVITSASGGMNPNYRAGDVVIIEDHVNLTFGNPLVGPHDIEPDLGYPDMSRPYDAAMMETARAIARSGDFAAHLGVYAGVLGPNYETRAEYRMLRRLGADVVGMSVVHETIAARQVGLDILGLSVVTNVCLPDALARASGAQVERVAVAAEAKIRAIVAGVIARHAA